MKAKGKKTIVEPVFDLYLSMTEREAQALYVMTRAIGGLPNGPRGVADDLQVALVNMGIRSPVSGPDRDYGGLKFPNTWGEFLAGAKS